MSDKVKVPGGAFYVGDGLTVDTKTRTVSANGGGGGSVSTPDWNQNDSTASDYIKNRPGGYEATALAEIYNGTVTSGKENVTTDQDKAVGDVLGTIGNTCSVTVDGVEYNNLVVSGQTGQGYVGDPDLTAYPFCLKYTFTIETFTAGFIFTSTTSGSHTLVVKSLTTTITPIDAKYLPNGNIMNGPYDGTFVTSSDNSITNGVQNNVGIIGSGNKVGSSTSLTIGYSNTNNGSLLMIGNNLNGSDAVTIGQYNKRSSTYDYKFVIGDGKSDTSRHNLFAIDENGKIIVPSSTNGSTKYFAITVDDTGTITATETTV